MVEVKTPTGCQTETETWMYQWQMCFFSAGPSGSMNRISSANHMGLNLGAGLNRMTTGVTDTTKMVAAHEEFELFWVSVDTQSTKFSRRKSGPRRRIHHVPGSTLGTDSVNRRRVGFFQRQSLFFLLQNKPLTSLLH